MSKFVAGIFFDMSHEEYLKVPALSYSGIKDMSVSPLTFWTNSWMNPNREQKSSPAMEFGSLFHERVLFGEQAFKQKYLVAPQKSDYPNCLDGVEALREKSGELGLKKSGTLMEMSERIADIDPTIQLWPLIVQSFEKKAASYGATIIKPDMAAQIESMAAAIDSHPTGKKMFRGGAPEVSIFWQDDETGVPMKARIDYLRPTEIIDLKTFSNTSQLPVEHAVIRAVATMKYHVQAVCYLEAESYVHEFIMQGKVFGNVPAEFDMDALLAGSGARFFFMFVETGGVPNVIIKEFRRTVDNTETVVFSAAEKIYRSNIDKFENCMLRYSNKPWVEHQPITIIDDVSFPLWAA